MVQRQLGDFAVDIEIQGAGRTVVLVHGSASDRRTWDNQVTPLSEHATVVTYSRRYHWPNEPATNATAYSMATHVMDLVALIQSLGDEPVDIVGHSYGGFVSLLASLRHPELIRKQVLLEPPVVPLFLSQPPRPVEILRLLLSKPKLAVCLVRFGATGLVPATKAAESGDMDRAIRTLGRAILGKETFSLLKPDRWQQVLANNIRAEYLSDSFDPLSAEQVQSIQTPTLLMSAQNSPSLWPMLVDELDLLLPDSSTVAVPDASHIMHEDNPEFVNQRVVDFLRDEST